MCRTPVTGSTGLRSASINPSRASRPWRRQPANRGTESIGSSPPPTPLGRVLSNKQWLGPANYSLCLVSKQLQVKRTLAGRIFSLSRSERLTREWRRSRTVQLGKLDSADLQAEVDHLRTLDEQREMEIMSLYADADGRRGPTGLGTERRTVFPELARESQFVLRSSDGEFSLGIDGTLIGRYEVNRRRDDGTGSSNTDQGFQTTGTRINFQGKLYGDYGYWVRFNADDFGDPFIDAILGLYHFNDHMTLVVGQFPSLLNREQGIPADKLQLQESSPTDYTFDPFGYKGVMLAYHTPRMVYRGIINDGYRSSNNSAFAEPSAAWALAGQISGLAVGDEDDWPRFNNFTSRPGSDFAWLLNGAFHVQEGDSHDGNTGSSDDVFLGIAESSMRGRRPQPIRKLLLPQH